MKISYVGKWHWLNIGQMILYEYFVPAGSIYLPSRSPAINFFLPVGSLIVPFVNKVRWKMLLWEFTPVNSAVTYFTLEIWYDFNLDLYIFRLMKILLSSDLFLENP